MKGQVDSASRILVAVLVTLMILEVGLNLSTAIDDKIRMESLGMVEQRIEGNTLMISQVEDGMMEMKLGAPYNLTSSGSLVYTSDNPIVAVISQTRSKKSLNFDSSSPRLTSGKSDSFCITNSKAVNPQLQVAAKSCSDLMSGEK